MLVFKLDTIACVEIRMGVMGLAMPVRCHVQETHRRFVVDRGQTLFWQLVRIQFSSADSAQRRTRLFAKCPCETMFFVCEKDLQWNVSMACIAVQINITWFCENRI